MKKIFSFKSGKGALRWGSSTSPQDDDGRVPAVSSSSAGYSIRDKDLGKIHKAASNGNVATVQQILLLRKNGLNDRDKMSRTALHLACANGHQEVVTLLLERKCQLSLRDSESRTPLMKAVQCQQEECATLLLDHGADPNLVDVFGNTALHYAVSAQNVSIVAKLLSHNADTEARNKDDLTPLLLALNENKQQMVELLINKDANFHAVDKIKCNHQLISQYKEEKRLNSSPAISNSEDESSEEEDSLSRLCTRPGVNDSWPTSDDEELDFETKTVPKLNFAKLMSASQQCRKSTDANCAIMRPENRSLSEDNNSDSKNEDVVETLPKPSVKAQDLSHPVFPSPAPLLTPFKSLTVLDITKEEATKPVIGNEETGNDVNESAAQEHTSNHNLTYVDGAHKNSRRDMMSALGLGEEDDIESPWDSESISESLPQKYVDDFSGAANQRGENMFNGQVDDSPEKYPHLKPNVEVKDAVAENTVDVKDTQISQSDMSAELDLEMASEEDQERLDGSENNHPLVEEEEKMHKNSDIELSENIRDDGADNHGLIQQAKSEKTDKQDFSVMENEDSDSNPGLPMKEVKKNENEKWTVKESVTTSTFEKADCFTGNVLQMNTDSSLSEVDRNDGR